MAYSFTIGGHMFTPLGAADTDGQYALADVTESAIVDIIRYHAKGVNGSYKNFGGISGYKLKFKMRYIGTNPKATMNTDQEAWENASVTISAINGKTYLRCTLAPGGMKPVRQPQACGRGTVGQQFMDVEAELICDGGKQ